MPVVHGRPSERLLAQNSVQNGFQDASKMDPKFDVFWHASWKRLCSDFGPIWEPKFAHVWAIFDACFRLVFDLVLDTVFDLLQGHVPGQVGGKQRAKTMEGL